MKKKTMYLCVSGILFITVVVIGYIVYVKRMGTKELFTTQSLLETPGSMTISNTRAPLPTRPCALYYTDNIDLCNDSVNNWYTRSIQDLKSFRDDLIAKRDRSYTEDNLLQTVTKVIQERERGTLPNGVCKVEFPGWVEHQVTGLGEPAPYKNKANFANENRLMTEDWAYCFKPAATKEQAIANAKAFADEYVVKSFDDAGDYFQDGKVYGKIAFTTIHLDDSIAMNEPVAIQPGSRASSINSFICSTPPVPVENVPSTMIAFDLLNDTIRKLYILRFNKSTQRFEVMSQTTDIFTSLFVTVLNQNNLSLYLVPRTINGVINQFSFDVCGRVNQKLTTTSSFQLSLSSMGVQPKLLTTSSSKSDVTYGTFDELKARVININNQINEINATIGNMEIAMNTTSSFKNGFIRYTYQVTWKQTDIPLANDRDLSLIFDGVNGQGPYATITKREVLQSAPSERTFAYSPMPEKYGYVFEGYINIGSMPSDTYEFNINSDDGGDFFINNDPVEKNRNTMRLVASHYNQHSMNNMGAKGIIYLSSNKHYRFRARFIQWKGTGSGVVLQMRPYGSTTWKDIEPSLLYYNENDNTRYEINGKQLQKQQLVSSKALLEQTVASIEQNIKQHVNLAVQSIEGKRLAMNYVKQISMDGRLYVDIGALLPLSQEQESYMMYSIIHENIINVVRESRELPSPVKNFDVPLQYSISFWIYIDAPVSSWTNIFFHGVHNNVALIPDGDRTPGIWLKPGGSKLRFRQRSTVSGDDGCDTQNDIDRNRWVHFVVTVNGTMDTIHNQPPRSIQMFMDGVKLNAGPDKTNFKELDASQVWHWGPANRMEKRARVGYENSANAINAGVYVQKLYWFNRVISYDEVLGMYNNSGIMRNKRSDCKTIETPWKDAYGLKTNILSQHTVQCEPEHALSSLNLELGPNNTARMQYRCCKISSDDPLTTSEDNTQTATGSYQGGDPRELIKHAVSCPTGAIKAYNLFTNPSINALRYNYTCMDTQSSKINIQRTCTSKTSQPIPMNSSLQPFDKVKLQCNDMQHISRIQLENGDGNNVAQYKYDCCEIGGL